MNKPSGLDEVDKTSRQAEEKVDEHVGEEKVLELDMSRAADLDGKTEDGGRSPGLDSLNDCWVRGGWNDNPTLLEPCLGGWNSGGPGYGRFCQGWKAGDWPPF